ncbi:peroxiredoxin [Euryarchaeota archaeon]|nr:peroxiredoxin [Euryarchaeota archaeon]
MADTHEYLVNTKFPEFSLYDDEKLVCRADIEGKWTVIFFYPKDDSPGCTLQSCSFRDQYEQFTEKGILLYGVSSDSISSHRSFKKKYNLQYSLLSDNNSELAKSLKLKRNFGFLDARVTFVINPYVKSKTCMWRDTFLPSYDRGWC